MAALENISNDANVLAWLHAAPSSVVAKTGELLSCVGAMRANEVIYPAQDYILRALELTGPDAVRVVILGQDPYHEPGQAMGLSFSVPSSCKLPPSLRNIYKEMAADLGCAMPAGGDLTSWAAQGVLLLNTTLTVREHDANSHARLGWDTLTDHIISTCFKLPQPVVFMGWGRKAIDLIEKASLKAQEPEGNASIRRSAADMNAVASSVARKAATGAPEHGARERALGCAPERKPRIYSTHPSPLSARRAQADLQSFFGSRPFSTANKLLQACGSEPVRWESVLDGAR